jgi:hypothetical protein
MGAPPAASARDRLDYLIVAPMLLTISVLWYGVVDATAPVPDAIEGSF